MLLDHPLETKDLLLRCLEPTDAEGPYVAWMRDPEITRYLEVRFQKHDVTTLVGFIKNNNASDDNLLLGLFPKSEPRRHIGNIKLGAIDWEHAVAPIGIAIGAKDFWGRGLATQAVAAMSDYAFTTLGLHRVEAGFYGNNQASQRAFRSAGFVEEGRRRERRLFEGIRVDEVIMARLRDRP